LAREQGVITLFLNSPEFQTLAGDLRDPARALALVDRLYQDVLGRAPTEAEVAFWTAQIAAVGNADALVRALLGSVDFQATPRTPAELATVLFHALLGRDPTSAELSF